MKRDSWDRQSIQDKLKENAVFIHINARNNRYLPGQLGVRTVPSTLIGYVKSDGRGGYTFERTDYASGYMGPNQLSRFLEEGRGGGGMAGARSKMDRSPDGPSPGDGPVRPGQPESPVKPAEIRKPEIPWWKDPAMIEKWRKARDAGDKSPPVSSDKLMEERLGNSVSKYLKRYKPAGSRR